MREGVGMSIVKNGRISSNDQKVKKDKFDSNYDGINWKSKNDKTKSQSGESKDR